MRNLKRALSLALASVMVIGMMVVGTGASYQDVKATDNVEAIEVLQAVGIMTGDENGDFNPDANVTRNEIAVVMANLLNLDYDYYRGVNPFTDVPDWAAPYVAACAAEGVVAGIGGTLYGGSQNVTAAQASLMIMKALGYFQYQADFENDWQIATIRQASYINLFDGINANAETALTRNQIAQLVLNGLKANMVTFTGTVGAEINGVTIGYKPEYTAITNANKKYDSIDMGTSNIGADDKFYVQLGEELYNGDLKLTADTDVFGRPARCWEYDGKEIGTYVNDSMMIQEYTAKVTGDMLYELLTRSTVNTYELTVVIDGLYKEDGIAAGFFDKNEINRNNDETLGNTGNGVLTQVFVDNEEKTITITIINTYLAIANKDYDEKKDEIGFDVWGVDAISGEYVKALDDNSCALKVSGEDFDIADLAEKDAVLVTIADGEIQTISDCEVVAGTTIDAFETGSNLGIPDAPKAVEIDGTEYKFSSSAEFDVDTLDRYTGTGATNLKDVTYNVYMDAYGYVIGVEEVEAVDNFVFITGIDLEGSYLGARTAKASAIFLDGTMATIDVNMTKSHFNYSDEDGVAGDGNAILNTWCTYTVNNNKVYTVNEISNVNLGGAVPTSTTKYAQYNYVNTSGADEEINSRNIILAGDTSGTFKKVYGTDETVYLTVDVEQLNEDSTAYGIVDSVESVITGIDNANLLIWDQDKAADEADKTIAPADGEVTTANATKGTYTLYNHKGDIVATVVVGEDAGSSKNLVYAHTSAVYREKYDASTDTWTWSRKVISNGQEVILTEVGEGLDVVSGLGSMVQHQWYQVKYNAEGNVIEVSPVAAELTLGTDLITDFDDIDTAVKTEDTVLYYGVAPQVNSSDLKLVGKTLWLKDKDSGFRVSEDVNVALIQWNNNDKKTYFETGVNSLKNVVNELNERHDGMVGHGYIVSAILEKGVATSIVIYDYNRNCDPYTDGDWETGKTGTLDLTGLSFSADGMQVSFYNETGSNILGTSTADVLVRNADGVRVTYEKNVSMSAVANGDLGTILFSYDQVPTTAGKYSVELTIKDAAGKVIATGTATLANA